jgi:hypothetical protein
VLKRLCILLSLVLLIPVLAGCGSALNASLGSEFTLSIGRSAHITSEGIDIKFVDVTTDSRCPTGVECIQAGVVTCETEITKDDVKTQLILSEAGTTINNTPFQNYTFNFHVSPYPEAGKKIAKSDYRLYLTVSKSGQ